MMQLRAIPRTRGMSPVEAAAHWLVRRDAHELSPSEEAEFDAWRADPVNADAYRRASGAMGLFDSDLGTDPHLKALRQAALDAAPAPRRRFQAVAALMAASLVGAITLVAIERSGPVAPTTKPTAVAQAPVTPVVQPVRGAPTEYVTGVGERRTIKLADGTTVTLNTRTRLAIAFTDGRRLVRLLRGQALFEVFHDPALRGRGGRPASDGARHHLRGAGRSRPGQCRADRGPRGGRSYARGGARLRLRPACPDPAQAG
jgi:transmembrane sensor